MIIFDVGANDGHDCAAFADDPANTVYAFEPTPELVERCLKSRVKDNYIVIQKAVGNFCGLVDFYVAGTSDWGCSSIHQFSDGLETTWPGRDDFKVTHSYKVEIITMERFLEDNPQISFVDYLHCDTQGNDLNVLLGFGKHINKLRKGSIEVYSKNPLYKNTNNYIEDALDFLNKNNFKVTEKRSNDPFNNEINLYFEKE